jgi:hypothetical protein
VLGLAAVAIGMSVTLAAVQYLPLLNFSRATVRVNAGSADFASSFSAPIGHLVTLIVPNFFGEVIRIGTWSVPGQQEITHYVGVLIFFLAILGVQLTRQRCLLFFLVLAVIALILQLGPDGVLFTFLYRFVPGFSMTRAPGRAGLIYTFAVVTVAGLVWSELEGAPQDTIKRLLGIFGRSLIWVVSALTVAAALLSFILYAIFTTNGPAWTWHLADQLTQFLVLFWATMALFTAWRNRSITQRTLNLLAVVVLVFDLWSYGLKSVRPGTDPVGPAWRDATNFVQRKLDYRVEPVGEIPFTQDDSPLAYRIRSHYGYDSLVLGRYQALLNSAPDYFDRVFDLLNVGYVITQKPVEFKESGPKLDLYNQTESVWVYRRPDPLPRAFIVHEAEVISDDQEALAALHAPEFNVARTVTLPLAPSCSLEPAIPSAEEAAQLVGESPDHLELTTHSERAGLLVLSEVDYPGWQASVDGQSVQVLRADTILRAVCLPAGSHTVRFDFQPRDLVVGAAISSLALVVVMGVIIERWISARRVTRSR